MVTSTVFENNKTQAVRLPLSVRYPSTTKKVLVRSLGHDRVISPIDHVWDSFFLSPENEVSEDFMPERAAQLEAVRESFDA